MGAMVSIPLSAPLKDESKYLNKPETFLAVP